MMTKFIIKKKKNSNQLKIADLILDRDTRKVTRAGNEIDLSAKEFMVLECLMRNKNIVIPNFISI